MADQPLGVDTRHTDALLELMLSASAEQRSAGVRGVTAAPDRVHPGAFVLLSAVRLADGDPVEAMFWFYAGQLRARFDANRTTDATAGAYVARLTERFGPPINQYAFAHLDELEAVMDRVLAFDRDTPHHYDPRWINVRSMVGMSLALGGPTPDPASLTRPESEWAAIAEQTRNTYADGFRSAVARARAEATHRPAD